MAGETNPEGMQAARRYAAWHLGDAGWAGEIIYAFENPEWTNKQLDEEWQA